jgi:hypothetical protein
MTAVNTARATARRAARNPVLVGLTRTGFIGYGLVHLALGSLAIQIALGHSVQEGDQSGAFHVLAGQPFGKLLLIVVAVGLAAMAIWQLLLAAVGHVDKRGKARTFERIASGARVVVYAVLAWTAYKVLKGTAASSARQQQDVTSGVMSHRGGVWLIGIVGLGVVALGIGLIWYGAKHQFERKLMTGQMSRPAKRVARWLGTAGYVAKGVAFGIVGILLVDAAVTHDPGASTGLDAALRALAAQPYGAFLLVVVGAGVIAFGVFCFFQARYRKVGS